jgi:hypothetical protein
MRFASGALLHSPGESVEPRTAGCAIIVVRIAWVFTSTYLLRLISAPLRKRDPYLYLCYVTFRVTFVFSF